jgi:hypothetical protein
LQEQREPPQRARTEGKTKTNGEEQLGENENWREKREKRAIRVQPRNGKMNIIKGADFETDIHGGY